MLCGIPRREVQPYEVLAIASTVWVAQLMSVGRARSAMPARTSSVTSSAVCASWASTP